MIQNADIYNENIQDLIENELDEDLKDIKREYRTLSRHLFKNDRNKAIELYTNGLLDSLDTHIKTIEQIVENCTLIKEELIKSIEGGYDKQKSDRAKWLNR